MAYEDLLKDTSRPDPDNKDYFLLTITDLDLNKSYPLQFRWVYTNDKPEKDREWSVVKTIQTPAEIAPNTPRLFTGDVIGDAGLIIINWDGKDTDGNNLKNYDRVEIYITDDNNTFGDGTKPVDFFKVAGTKSIAAPAGTYTIFLKAVTKLGTRSNPSNSVTITITGGTLIEDPTLPIGLSVETVPFGLAVNWNGTYSSDKTFSGFKSVNIYATTSNLGSSTTSGILSSNLVGNLTVDKVVNRLNIGLDNLKQATGTNATNVYTTDVFLYYIATNLNDVVYKVGGVPTYTRINSVGIRPNQANFIDLANGVISIENLVAGNGQFTSWLRAGSAGGARIELNGGASFSNGGNLVLPGFSVYSTGNTAIFRADLSGNVTFGGYTPTDIQTINNNANLTLQKTVNLNSSGNIISPVNVPAGQGAIYSGKTSFSSFTNGWYLGYDSSNNPSMHIGNSSKYLQWNGTTGNLTVKGSIEGSTFTSTNGSTNGITIQSGTGSDTIEFYRSSGLKGYITGTDTGFLVWGPNGNYMTMVNGGAIVINSGTTTGAYVLFSTSGAVINQVDTSPNIAAFRNIVSSTSAPVTTSGGAAGYYNGDIYLVRDL